jgi:transposase InsO family protein
VRSDDEMEFKNTGVEDYLSEEGIKHEFSVPYTPQQNGVLERKNQTFIEVARTVVQYTGHTLGQSCQHRVSCNQPSLSPQDLQEDDL